MRNERRVRVTVGGVRFVRVLITISFHFISFSFFLKSGKEINFANYEVHSIAGALKLYMRV